MITPVHSNPLCLTTQVRSGTLHSWLLARPDNKAMVVIPYSFRGLTTAADEYLRNFMTEFTDALLRNRLTTLIVDLITPLEDSDHQLRMDTELHTHRLYLSISEAERQCNFYQPVGLAGIGLRGLCCLLTAKRHPLHIKAVACIDLPSGAHTLSPEPSTMPLRLLYPGLDQAPKRNVQHPLKHSEMAAKLASWFRQQLDINPTAAGPAHHCAYQEDHGYAV